MTDADKIQLLNFLLKHDPEDMVKTFIQECKMFELRKKTRKAREGKVFNMTLDQGAKKHSIWAK